MRAKRHCLLMTSYIFDTVVVSLEVIMKDVDYDALWPSAKSTRGELLGD